MALPKLETKTYTLTLPSTGKEIKYRPFLVKEQKTLLMAQESNSQNEVVDAMTQLINDCTFGKVDPKTCPMFDAEYIFLKLRAKSVGEKAEVQVTCPDDEKTKVTKTVKLEDVDVIMKEGHSNEIAITDKIKIVMRYPRLDDMVGVSTELSDFEKTLVMLVECVDSVVSGGEEINRVDMTREEITEFVDSMDNTQIENVVKFFDTMPKVRHIIDVINPKTKKKGEILLEGLESFLA